MQGMMAVIRTHDPETAVASLTRVLKKIVDKVIPYVRGGKMIPGSYEDTVWSEFVRPRKVFAAVLSRLRGRHFPKW